MLLLALAAIGGLVVKLPALVSVDEELYFPRNLGLALFPLLAIFFASQQPLKSPIHIVSIGTMVAGILYINFLPGSETSQTWVLACLHWLVVQWALMGLVFTGTWKNDVNRRLQFLRFQGELVVICAILLIAGGLLSAITIGLFRLAGFQIENFYFDNIVAFLLPAVPLLGTHLIQTNPQLVGKVSPVVARIFSPLALVMLLVYLSVIAYAGKNPYTDRDFLLLFNGLLVWVMALVFFSATDSGPSNGLVAKWVLLLLCMAALLVNGIALSAIVFRISHWGLTPNRLAVLGSNLLMAVHLVLITRQMYRMLVSKRNTLTIEKTLTAYLPAYIGWALVVMLLFPVVFGLG